MGDGPSLSYWPWFLLATPAPLPERLLGADPDAVLDHAFDTWSDRPEAIEERSRMEYRRAMTPATIAAMCGDYRASLHLDREDDAADRHAGRRIIVPVLIVTGDAETQLANAPDVWRPGPPSSMPPPCPVVTSSPKKHRHNSSSDSSPFCPGRHIRETSERHRPG